MPEEWALSRICEEFGIPLVAGGAVDQPWALAVTIMDMRAFATAYDAVSDPKRQADVPDTPMTKLAKEIVNGRLSDLLQARRAKTKGKGKA